MWVQAFNFSSDDSTQWFEMTCTDGGYWIVDAADMPGDMLRINLTSVFGEELAFVKPLTPFGVLGGAKELGGGGAEE